MPQIDLVDDTFVVAGPRVVSAIIHQEERWRAWWPDLRLSVFEDRAERGIRWNVAGGPSVSSLLGSMEVWLEPFRDGVIVHYFLRVDLVGADPGRPARVWPARAPGRRPVTTRRLERERHRWQHRTKSIFWSLKDEVEADRQVGEPRPRPAPAAPPGPEPGPEPGPRAAGGG